VDIDEMVKLRAQKSFGKRYDHFQPVETVLQSLFSTKLFFSKIEILSLEIFFSENLIFQLFFQSPYIIMGRLLWFEGCQFRPKSRVFTCKNSYLKELIPLEKVEDWSFCGKPCFDMFDRYAI